MDRALHFLFKTNSGRLVVVALIAMLAAYIARLELVDKPAAEAKEASGVGAETLERMADTLLEKGDAVTLPARTAWYPADVPCGADAPYPTQRDPIWDLLGLEKTGNTLFQYRFEHADGDIKIHARRDSDCDGFYAVWLLEGSATSSLGRDLTAQNILE